MIIEYIGDVLPELGVDKICQTTYADYVQNALKLKLKLTNPNEQLEKIIEQAGNFEELHLSKMKGSPYYELMMQRYLTHYEQQLATRFDDVFIEKYRIIKGEHLKKLFLVEFHYMPIEKRLERIKKIIQTEVKRKTTAVLAKLNARYEDAIGRALNGMRDADKRRRTVTKMIDERDERIPKIKQEAKTTATAYMKKFTKSKIKTLYRELVTSRELLYEIAPEWAPTETESFLKAHKKESWALEYLAALYYLQAKVKGIDEKWKMRVVFIDEVQDYSYFQLAALKAGLETDMFTMVGDLAQGIHSYRSLTEWQPVLDLFPRATYATLQKSYRTTIEIMELANEILAQMNEELPLVEPVVRHGNVPEFILQDALDVETIAKTVEAIKANHHQSIALICKTTTEAKSIVKKLQQADFPAQLLDEDSGIDQQKLLVVPSHLAKGLEFDAVIIVSFEAPYYDNPIDRKLLYVALTRAMHELYLIGPSKETFLM